MLDLDAIKARWEAYGNHRLSLTANLHLSTDLQGPGDTFLRVEMPSNDEDAILQDMAYAPADIAALTAEVGHLRSVIKTLIDIHVVDRMYVRTTIFQSPDTYAAWHEAMAAVYGSEATDGTPDDQP